MTTTLAQSTDTAMPASTDAVGGTRRRAASGKSIGRRLRGLVPPAIVFGVIIGAWYFVSNVVLAPRLRYMLPEPHEIIRIGFMDSHNLSELMQALAVTTKVTFAGLGIAIVLGVGSGMLMTQAKWLEASLFPWAIILQTVPILALIPMISFWFGYGISSRILVCVLIAFFPIVSNTVFGLQSADRGMHELFSLHGANRFTRLWKLQLPAALPAIFAGFKVSAGLAVIGAIVGDLYFKQGVPGIGTLLSVYTSRLEGERLFAAILLSSLLGVAVFLLFGWLGNRAVGRWYNANRG
ncbi:MAG: binding-protein-dependent transport system inner rane component [Pseudonocardiales bacterium]|nr:binding-protein-dependent transport system inner rane component [Pseudonocardiales bacterium]